MRRKSRRQLKRNTGRPRPGTSCYYQEEEPYPLPPDRRRRTAGAEPNTPPPRSTTLEGSRDILPCEPDQPQPPDTQIRPKLHLCCPSPERTLPRRRLQGGHDAQRAVTAQSKKDFGLSPGGERGWMGLGPQLHLQGGRAAPKNVAATGLDQPTNGFPRSKTTLPGTHPHHFVDRSCWNWRG